MKSFRSVRISRGNVYINQFRSRLLEASGDDVERCYVAREPASERAAGRAAPEAVL